MSRRIAAPSLESVFVTAGSIKPVGVAAIRRFREVWGLILLWLNDFASSGRRRYYLDSIPSGTMWRFARNNAITEGFHTKMEVLQRQAYGFRNFDNYRLRVEIMCS